MADTADQLREALRDRYLLERELGQGGMATVYIAHDLKHDRDVALKVLRPELAAVLGAERFLREIRLTAQLQHPHIVTLIDSGEAGGTLYYVLPYIDGESLRQRLIREGQMPLDEVLGITRAVAGALQYAHDQGVIHRDIKPENILLSRGEPVVADFGIALAAASAGRERLTETGLSLGTPAYMSPEQASAEPRLDGRSDQYSLACVVYEMLAGEPPYTGATAQAIIAKRLSEPVPRLGTLRQVPAAVEAAVTRALAKRPADRFGTVAEFGMALERPGTPGKRLLTRRMAALLGGGAALGGITLLAWLFRPATPPPPMVTRQLTLTGNAHGPSLSPDSKWGAYVSGDSILVQELSGSQPVLAARNGVDCDAPKWSPDGTALLFTTADSAGRIWLATVPRLGGPVSRLAHAGCGAFGYSPDGRGILFSPGLQDSVFIMDPTSGDIRRRFSVTPTSFTAWRVVYSPDGRWILFGGEQDGIPYLAVVSPDGSTIHRLVDWVDRGTLQWSPRGDAIYFFQRVPGGADMMKVRIDPETGERRGDPVRVISHSPFTEFFVGADGRTLLYQKVETSLQVWTFSIAGPPGHKTVTPSQLTKGTANFGSSVISPDGRLVLYAQDDANQRSIYVVPYEGGGAPRLIGATRSDWMTPQWAPDSRRIAFTPPDSTLGGIMIADLSGGRPRRYGASRPGHYLTTIGWARDGQKLLYPSDDPRKLILLDLEKNEEVAISAPPPLGWLRAPVFAPDGQALVIASVDHDYRHTLYRVRLATGEWERLGGTRDEGAPLLWSPEGWIYYQQDRRIRRIRPSGEQSSEYVTLPRDCVGFSLVSLDGSASRAVCRSGESTSDIWVATGFDPQVRR